ncbi:glycosyltransferase family 39 protein [Pedobacter changchengzhani]|uniref:Glycosyltransferase family 39 protein n=1 Tax=Pedobacter changchengzhani TaxID=2529274 RepID=A0A4R5MKN3_9SPHI|nr:glycosyltransferase family 39 protein [Pedobacter changchengzhani]TDG36158.1 glycosyltransferase family 39 protein [Pedobacter changchengzhani]
MKFNSKVLKEVIGAIPFLLLFGILIIRLASIWLMGPMPQDAYYFFYAQHPALSYFDHPPAIAVLLKIFTSILGKHVYAIKLADSLLTVAISISLYQLAIKFFPNQVSKKIIILFLSTLMVSVLSLVSTPDTPLLFFWALTLIALFEAIFNNKKSYWLIAGVLMGLAFDSKYTAVFLPAGMILFLLLSTSKRKYLLSVWPWLACIIMVFVAAPVIIWNVQNHFASFAFQGAQRMHAAAAFQLQPKFVAGLIGHQLFLLIPIGLIAIFYALIQIIKKYKNSWKLMPAETVFLLCFFLPLFSVFLILSPIYWIKINWMMPAYITGIILAGNVISKKWLNVQVVISFVVHFGLLIEVLFYPFPIKSDDTWVGWKEVTEKANAIQTQQHANFIFSADNYKTTAELNLFSNEFVYGQNIIGEHALQFDFIGTDLTALNGKSAIFLDSDPQFKNNDQQVEINPNLKSYFRDVKQLQPIIISFNNKPVRKFYVYLCEGYKPKLNNQTTELRHN